MPSIPPPSKEARRQFLDFRDQVNLRSAKRNDSAVVSILETSLHSVIYHFNEVEEKWEKQKQEGPLFLVHRRKSPEYALYMLNRMSLTNVSIPLIPGEMKITTIDDKTIQVARRGQKVRRAIWFSEGELAVSRFREAILRICGDPVPRQHSVSDLSHSISNAQASSSRSSMAVNGSRADEGNLTDLLNRLVVAQHGTPPIKNHHSTDIHADPHLSAPHQPPSDPSARNRPLDTPPPSSNYTDGQFEHSSDMSAETLNLMNMLGLKPPQQAPATLPDARPPSPFTDSPHMSPKSVNLMSMIGLRAKNDGTTQDAYDAPRIPSPLKAMTKPSATAPHDQQNLLDLLQRSTQPPGEIDVPRNAQSAPNESEAIDLMAMLGLKTLPAGSGRVGDATFAQATDGSPR